MGILPNIFKNRGKRLESPSYYMNLLENKSIKCINFLVAQHNEVTPWYTKTNMNMYKQFYHEYVCFPLPLLCYLLID